MSFAVPFDLAIFLLGTFAAAFVTGLAGFAFGMVAAGIWLFALTPVQTTTLIVAYALLVQGYSTWRLRRTIIPSRLSSLEAPSEFPQVSPFSNWHRPCT